MPGILRCHTVELIALRERVDLLIRLDLLLLEGLREQLRPAATAATAGGRRGRRRRANGRDRAGGRPP